MNIGKIIFLLLVGVIFCETYSISRQKSSIVISDNVIEAYSAEKLLEYLKMLKNTKSTVRAQNPKYETLLVSTYRNLNLKNVESLKNEIAGTQKKQKTVQTVVLSGYTDTALLDYLKKLKQEGYSVVAENKMFDALLQQAYQDLTLASVQNIQKAEKADLKDMPIELSAALIEKYSEDELAELLERLHSQGYKVKGQTPEITQDIQEVYAGAVTQQEVAELKKEVAEISPQPPAPKLPVPPAMPESKKPIEPLKPKKPEVKDDILPALSQNELENLSEKQKNESDDMVKRVIAEIAHNIFLYGDTKVEPKILKPPRIETSLQAYQFYIEDYTTQELGRQEEFKKRDQLRDLLGVGQRQPQLKEYIAEKLTAKGTSVNELMNSVRENLQKGRESSLVKELGVLIKPLLFTESEVEKYTEYMATIIANIALTQRPITLTEKWTVEGVGSAQKIESDGLVSDIIEVLVRDAQKELPALPEKTEQETEDAYQARIKEALDKKLSKDYIAEFGNKLNILRLDTEFFNFFALLGHAAQERVAKITDPVVKLFSQPLLDMVQISTDPGFFKPQTFLGAVRKQLYFNPDDLKDVVKSDSLALRAMLNDHTLRLLESRGKIDIEEFLTDRINVAKDVKSVLSALGLLEKSLGKNEYISSIQVQLTSLDPNPEQVIEAFKQLAGKGTLAFEPHLKELIDAYLEKTKTQRTAINILKAAKAQYKETKQDQGAYILKELSDQLGAKLTFTQKKVLTAVDRTAQSVKRLFDTLAGADRVQQVASIDDFYAMVAPYGLLVMVLQDIAKEGEKLKTSDRITLLFDSLNSLQDGTVIAGRSYVTAITQNQEVVKARVYKDKLTKILDALKLYSIDTSIEEITDFVKQADVGVENSKEFKDSIAKLRAFLVPTFLGALIDDLKALNAGSGDYQIKGLALEGSYKRRNASVYRFMKNYYTPLIDLLAPNGMLLPAAELIKLNKDAYEKDVKSIAEKLLQELKSYPSEIRYSTSDDAGKETESKDILSAVEAYLITFTKQLDYIVEAAEKVATPVGGPSPIITPGQGPPPPPGLPGWGSVPKPPEPPKPPSK